MKQDEKNRLLNEQQTLILDRKGRLTSTDYIAVKIAEGSATAEEYRKDIAQRQQWRSDINAAQKEIARLEAIKVEPEAGA